MRVLNMENKKKKKSFFGITFETGLNKYVFIHIFIRYLSRVVDRQINVNKILIKKYSDEKERLFLCKKKRTIDAKERKSKAEWWWLSYVYVVVLLYSYLSPDLKITKIVFYIHIIHIWASIAVFFMPFFRIVSCLGWIHTVSLFLDATLSIEQKKL